MNLFLHKQPFLTRLLASLAVFTMAVLVSLAIHSLDQKYVISLYLFLAAVMICSLFGGLWISIGSAVLGTLTHGYFFQLPVHYFSIDSDSDRVELAAFLLIAMVVSWIGSSYRRALTLTEQSREAAEFEKRSREDVLAIVSHDLKNPLAAIQMNTQLVQRMIHEVDVRSSEVLRRTESILGSARHMSRLIQDLQDYERMRAGTFQVTPQSVVVKDLLREFMTVARAIAETKEIQLSDHCDPPGAVVYCDPGRTIQVLSNLVGNAVKFTAHGGRVEVIVRSRQGKVSFEVTDTGPGIPDHQLVHVFDRYWQSAQSSRQGAGLGLAIAKGIVDSHQGEIWVMSRLGEGSTFGFVLPEAFSALPANTPEVPYSRHAQS